MPGSIRFSVKLTPPAGRAEVPLRDGSTMALGRYLLFVEVGDPEWLRARRLRLLKGEPSPRNPHHFDSTEGQRNSISEGRTTVPKTL